ncbi:hypothetical protein D3C76_1573220 [compost metagenome]
MLPALPPPTSASSKAVLEMPIFLPTDKAIGATIMIATVMNTPTAVIIIVASAIDNNAFFSPSLSTMVSAIRSAAPDSINTPASTPAASTRTTAPITLFVPSMIYCTVSAMDAPPNIPPAIAPKKSA